MSEVSSSCHLTVAMKTFQLIFLLECAVIVIASSPFNKQQIGQNRNGPLPWTSQWTNAASLQFAQNPFQQFVPNQLQQIDRKNLTLSGGIGTNVFDVIFQWNIMDFVYPSPNQRAQAISNGQFIPENVVPLGIAVNNDRVFVTTPRWNLGIPASLSVIQLPAFDQSPALIPYPDWNAHTSTTNPDCSRLLSVYRLAIDECNRLWIIDSGIINAITNLQQLCPPKIVAYDLRTNTQVVNYQFPADQVLQGSLHTNIVVDVRNGECNRAFVYVMDVWQNGLVVFDMAQGTSWRTKNHFYNSDPFASDYTYRNVNFQWTDGVFGGALSPLNKPAGDRVLYYHPMSSFNVSIAFISFDFFYA